MKKIFFGKNLGKESAPFWQPWGCMGSLGRFLVFFLLLVLLLLLLSLFRGCRPAESAVNIENPDNRGDSAVEEREDTSWNRPVEGGERVGLPSPDDNRLPLFDTMEPVPNPENGGANEIYPNLLYVIFDSGADDEVFKKFAKKFASLYLSPEHKIIYYNTGSKTAVLEVPEASRSEICRNMPGQISEIKFYVVPVEVMTQYSEVLPNDPAFSDAGKSWYFKPIQVPEAWTVTMGTRDIIVGIVDSYMDLRHPELMGDRCVYPYSVVKGNSDVAPRPGAPQDYAGHGTLVTAVAVGNANNNAGSSGIAPKCRFIPVSMGESINTITMVEGLLYCIYHGASVVNLSCGSAFTDEITRMPISEQIRFSEQYGKPQEEMWNFVFALAEKHNVAIVWAAGNENCYGAMDTSKRNAGTIRVSAVDMNLRKADFSNFGNFREYGVFNSTISAPGVDIWGALPNNSYDAWPGTSFSAPIITGVVALIKSENKDLTTSQIIKILQSTGKPVEGAPEIGNLVQVKDALDKARQIVASAVTENDSVGAD